MLSNIQWLSGKSIYCWSGRLGFDFRWGQTKDYEIGIHSFPVWRSAIKKTGMWRLHACDKLVGAGQMPAWLEVQKVPLQSPGHGNFENKMYKSKFEPKFK